MERVLNRVFGAPSFLCFVLKLDMNEMPSRSAGRLISWRVLVFWKILIEKFASLHIMIYFCTWK